MARKAKKGVQLKTETLTIRMDPRTRFALELMARKQHRTLTTVVEWALEQAIKSPTEGLGDLLVKIWDPIEADRFVKMALHCPDVLSFEEQLAWKMISEEAYFCHGEDLPGLYKAVRRQWEEIIQVINGEKTLQELGCWDVLLADEQTMAEAEAGAIPFPFPVQKGESE